MYSGKFIVLEGMDKAGKDTQANLLKDWLINLGFDICLTQEPTNGLYGQKIKKILTGEQKAPNPLDLQKLFIKDRNDHQQTLSHALQNNQIVICVRYVFSTIAYGSIAGLNKNNLITLNANFLYPDIIFYLDLTPNIALERLKLINDKPQYFEKQDKLTKVRRAYLGLAKELKNIIVIDATPQAHIVTHTIQNHIQKFLKI